MSLQPAVYMALRARADGIPPYLARNYLDGLECQQFEQVIWWQMYPERFGDELREAGLRVPKRVDAGQGERIRVRVRAGKHVPVRRHIRVVHLQAD